MSCGADTSANTLMQNLLAGKDFTVPNVELNSDNLKLPQGANSEMYSSILRLNVSDLTQGKVGGDGAFDALMTSVRAHLLQEYEKGRITGGEYTKAYAELVTASMEHATQFLLNKDQVYWTAQQSQIQSVTAMIQMESERMRLAALKFEALTSEANYALTKLKLANEDIQYCINKFNLEQMLPGQKSLLDAQVIGQQTSNDKGRYELTNMLPKQAEGLGLENDGKTISNNTATYNLSSILPKQAAMLDAQKDGQVVQNDQGRYTLQYLLPAQLLRTTTETEGIATNTNIARYNLTTMLPLQHMTGKYTLEQMMPAQKAMLVAQKEGVDIANETAEYNKSTMLPAQLKLTQEQTETQRAQTLNTRTDGSTVVGYVGKQKDLYSQQIDSYKRDAEIKAAKLVSDGWMTQKTIDEAALTPSSFQQNMVDSVLNRVKLNNGLA